MRTKRSCCLFCLSVLLAAGSSVAGAPASKEIALTAEELSRSAEWQLLREPRYERGYPWELKEGCLFNTAPAGTPYDQVKRMEKGMGLSIYGLKEPLTARYEVSGVFRMDAAAAAGFVLNSGLEGDALTGHYLLLVYYGGINLWKYTFTGEGKDQGVYMKLGWLARPLKADTDYELKVTAQPNTRPERGLGYELSVLLDGQHAFGVTDATPLPAGTLGIWLGEGFAGVRQVTIKR